MRFELTVVTFFFMSGFFISSLAKASYNSPEFLYQPKQGQHSLQLNVDRIKYNEEGQGEAIHRDSYDTISLDEILFDSSWVGINLQLTYELGLSDQLTLCLHRPCEFRIRRPYAYNSNRLQLRQ